MGTDGRTGGALCVRKRVCLTLSETTGARFESRVLSGIVSSLSRALTPSYRDGGPTPKVRLKKG